MKKKFLLPAMLLAAVFASCNSEENPAQAESRAALGVNVQLQEMSRAGMVSDQALPDDDPIGVSLVAADYSDYDDKTAGYINIAYKGTTTGTKQTWDPVTAGTQILLSGTSGVAYAYYPYTSTVTDYQSIPVDIAEQKDWMWSGESEPVNDAEPNVSFNLKHAQTAVNVNVVRDASYTGEGEIKNLSVTSDGLASTGKLSAVDGKFVDVNGAGAAVVIANDFTLDGTTLTSQENPYMFIPTSAEKKNFLVSAVIDGKAYNVGVTMNEAFQPGYIYKIAVKISNIGLTIDSVVIVEKWQEQSLPEGTLKPGTGA